MRKFYGVGEDVPFQVYITPLDNEKTTGEWVSFPTTPDHLRDVFARLEIGPSDWNITNVECNVYGIRETVWQCNSLDELNYLAAKLDELDAASIGTYQSLIEIDKHCDSVPELINLTDNLDCYDVEPEIYSYDDLARYVLFDRDSHSYNRSTLEILEDYIDYEGFGRSVADGEDGILAENCYISPSGSTFVEIYDGNPATIPEQYRVTQKIVVPELTDDERLDKAISLAMSLDHFFREFDKDYAAKFPEAQIKQEQICDDLYTGKIADTVFVVVSEGFKATAYLVFKLEMYLRVNNRLSHQRLLIVLKRNVNIRKNFKVRLPLDSRTRILFRIGLACKTTYIYTFFKVKGMPFAAVFDFGIHIFTRKLSCTKAKSVKTERVLIAAAGVCIVLTTCIKFTENKLPVVSVVLFVISDGNTSAKVLHLDTAVRISRYNYLITVAFSGFVNRVRENLKHRMFTAGNTV